MNIFNLCYSFIIKPENGIQKIKFGSKFNLKSIYTKCYTIPKSVDYWVYSGNPYTSGKIRDLFQLNLNKLSPLLKIKNQLTLIPSKTIVWLIFNTKILIL